MSRAGAFMIWSIKSKIALGKDLARFHTHDDQEVVVLRRHHVTPARSLSSVAPVVVVQHGSCTLQQPATTSTQGARGRRSIEPRQQMVCSEHFAQNYNISIYAPQRQLVIYS